jgi:hypothetical protein
LLEGPDKKTRLLSNHHRALSAAGNSLGEMDRRIFKDRRKQPTPGLSRYAFFGLRKGFRRAGDQQQGGYVDRYSARLLFVVTLILGLNILDALFTMMIIDLSGVEVNPVVLSVMHLYGDQFWIWKFGIVSFSLVLLCLHSRFGRVRPAVAGACLFYLVVVAYQIALIIYH